MQYGKRVNKKVNTFVARYEVAYGLIRVVILQETIGPSTSSAPCTTFRSKTSSFADRAAIEQIFHAVMEVQGDGQRQLRHLRANIGAWHFNLWSRILVELWTLSRPKNRICDRRASPWDDPDR